MKTTTWKYQRDPNGTVAIITDEPAHYMKPDEDCMGNATFGYWRQFLTCSDGKCVIGCGATKEEAEKDASNSRNERETFLSQPARKQLEELIAKDEICWADMQVVVKLMAQLILEK